MLVCPFLKKSIVTSTSVTMSAYEDIAITDKRNPRATRNIFIMGLISTASSVSRTLKFRTAALKSRSVDSKDGKFASNHLVMSSLVCIELIFMASM
ncbi:hypothetical protein TrCOL_g10805 [Triparma columacea]|uniref:Uncharacterized protein n=1 Tax=Triparma columacea TaxID=722753 RepID=A0A9W7L3Q4_9STRA|nr:hypothetical protein TrCOL_g10805 [Triparma columacea]